MLRPRSRQGRHCRKALRRHRRSRQFPPSQRLHPCMPRHLPVQENSRGCLAASRRRRQAHRSRGCRHSRLPSTLRLLTAHRIHRNSHSRSNRCRPRRVTRRWPSLNEFSVPRADVPSPPMNLQRNRLRLLPAHFLLGQKRHHIRRRRVISNRLHRSTAAANSRVFLATISAATRSMLNVSKSAQPPSQLRRHGARFKKRASSPRCSVLARWNRAHRLRRRHDPRLTGRTNPGPTRSSIPG